MNTQLAATAATTSSYTHFGKLPGKLRPFGPIAMQRPPDKRKALSI
jgi:hypothetical protein